MDADKAISKEGLKWRWGKHPKYPGDIICLMELPKRGLCVSCVFRSIPFLSQILYQ